jgi:hypothetical protein
MVPDPSLSQVHRKHPPAGVFANLPSLDDGAPSPSYSERVALQLPSFPTRLIFPIYGLSKESLTKPPESRNTASGQVPLLRRLIRVEHARHPAQLLDEDQYASWLITTRMRTLRLQHASLARTLSLSRRKATCRSIRFENRGEMVLNTADQKAGIDGKVSDFCRPMQGI